jgi:hypothetical protein
MSSARTRPFRLKLTVRQMMKLVAFSAIVLFCVVEGRRLEEELGWVFVLVMEGVAIPLVLAIVALPLVRKGPLKDWLIRILLLIPVSFTLVMVPGIFLVSASRWASDDPGMLVIGGCIILGCIIVLGWTLLQFLRRAVPGRCPECRLPTLLPSVPITRRFTREGVYQCVSCQGRFRKLSGAWKVTSPELDSGPGFS